MNLTVDLGNKQDIQEAINILYRLVKDEVTPSKATANSKDLAAEKITSGTVTAKTVETVNETKLEKAAPDKADPEPKPTTADPDPEVTKEMVQKRMKTMLKEQKRAEMVEILTEFGVKKLSEMTADAYPKFYTKMGELL